MKKSNVEVTVCGNIDEYARTAVGMFLESALESVRERGKFNVAIPGGWSPRPVFEMLASRDFAGAVPWDKTHVFFTDERCVPPDSDESNYKLAYDLFLSKVAIPEDNIHRFLAELKPEEAAEEYEDKIKEILGEMLRFDLVILGMGQDTHTASLFPHSPALTERERLAVPNYIEERNTCRLTLTIPILTNARRIIILVSGQEKSDALKDVLQGPVDIKLHPVQAIRPSSGELVWIVDADAGSKLEKK